MSISIRYRWGHFARVLSAADKSFLKEHISANIELQTADIDVSQFGGPRGMRGEFIDMTREDGCRFHLKWTCRVKDNRFLVYIRQATVPVGM